MQRPSKVWIPIKAQELINTVQAIIDDQRPTPFLNGRPGRKWYMEFLKGLPSLILREECLVPKRLQVQYLLLNGGNIQKFFSIVNFFIRYAYIS